MLFIIIGLAAIKFLLVPIFDWQNIQIKSINRQNSQLVKGLDLLANQKQLITQLQTLRHHAQRQLSLIARTDETAIVYQVNIQKQMEKLLEKYHLNARSTTWLNKVTRGNIEEHRLEIALKGSVKNFIEFISEIEQQKPKLAILEYRSIINQMSPQSHELGRFSGKFIVVGWRNIAGGKA